MAMLEPDPGFWTKTSLIQLGYGAWVSLSSLALGLANGFPAIQVPQLNHPDCTIEVTTAQMSWIASIVILFNPIGSILSGYLMDKFGRQPVMAVSELPLCFGWIYTALARTAVHIIIGRAITGIGCGMMMGVPRLYASEIALANMRGVLGAFPNMFISLGMTIQASMGSFIAWETISIICGVYNALLFFSYCVLEESPYFLLMKGDAEKALLVLTRIRASDYNVEAELNEMLEFQHDNNIRSLKFSEKIKAMMTKACCKPFCILMTYVLFGVLSGTSIVMIWTVEILLLSNTSFDAYYGNIAISSTRLVFGLIGSVVIYNVPRKTLAVLSSSGVGVACLTLGLVLYGNNSSFLPQLLLMVYIAFSSLGFFSLPFLLMTELYPLQLRGLLMGISISLTSLLVFASAKSFPFLSMNFGATNIFFMFGTFSLLGALFLYIFLPETKDLTLQEIEEYFNARRPTLVSQRSIISAQSRVSRDSSAVGNKDFKSKSILSTPTNTIRKSVSFSHLPKTGI